MVSCMPASMLPKIGLSSNDLTPNGIIRGMSEVDLQNCRTVNINITCNNITMKARFYVTKHDYAVILELEFCKKFKLVTVSPVCIQQHTISVESNKDEAVNITSESEVDYNKLTKKWKKQIPLGKQTGSALEDLKIIFPETFDGQVGLFECEAHLKVSPEAQPVQLPPRAVPQSIIADLKRELDKMEKNGIIRPCPETTDWVHNLVPSTVSSTVSTFQHWTPRAGIGPSDWTNKASSSLPSAPR